MKLRLVFFICSCTLLAVQAFGQKGSWLEVESNTLEAGQAVITGINTDTLASDGIGVIGISEPMDHYGVGGSFRGGYIGTVGTVQTDSSLTYFGTVGEVFGRGKGINYGVAGFAEGLGTNYGIYGSAVGGENNYAGYFDGDAYVASDFSIGGRAFFNGGTVRMENYLDGGRIILFDPLGRRKVQSYIAPSFHGIMEVYGEESGNRNVVISSPVGFPNNGYIAVYNEDSSIRSGMYTSEDGFGVIFADVKNFRMDHPAKSDKEIWYASIEGPEAAAYERGTSTLVNGEIFVEFSEHFKIVGNPKTMTVILTPLHSETYGLAVVEKTANGFKVKELMKGKGNFQFDWEVKAVRKGHEQFEVIRDSKKLLQETPKTGDDAVQQNSKKLPSPHLKDTKNRLRK